jgi:hypothetical protein
LEERLWPRVVLIILVALGTEFWWKGAELGHPRCTRSRVSWRDACRLFGPYVNDWLVGGDVLDRWLCWKKEPEAIYREANCRCIADKARLGSC